MPINAIPYTEVYEIIVDDISELSSHPELKDRVRVHVNGNPGKDYIFREDIPFADAPPGSLEITGLLGSLIEDSNGSSFGYIDSTTDLNPAGAYYVDVNDVSEITIPDATGEFSRRHFIITSDKADAPEKSVIGSLQKPQEEIIYTPVVKDSPVSFKFKIKSDGLLGRVTIDVKASSYTAPITGRLLIAPEDDPSDIIAESPIEITSEGLLSTDFPHGLEVSEDDTLVIAIEAFSTTGFELGVYNNTHYGFEATASLNGLCAEFYYLERTIPGNPTIGNASAPDATKEPLSTTTYKYQTFTSPIADTLESITVRLGVDSPTLACVARLIIIDDSGELLYTHNVMINTGDTIKVINGIGLNVLANKDYSIGLRLAVPTATASLYLSDATSNDIIGSFEGTSSKAQMIIGFNKSITTASLITEPNRSIVTFTSNTPFNDELTTSFSAYAGQEVIITDVRDDLYHLVIGGNTINESDANRFSLTSDMIDELAFF